MSVTEKELAVLEALLDHARRVVDGVLDLPDEALAALRRDQAVRAAFHRACRAVVFSGLAEAEEGCGG